MPLIKAYHVSTEPDLERITTNVCDDVDRDGYLYGAEVACFTTTLYKGGLPTFSPYPRSHEAGEYGYRYTKRFDPCNYDRYLMATTERDGVTQVHFLLLDKRRSKERVVSAVVREYLDMKNENTNGSSHWERYFPRGRANDYADDKVFVNVMFWHAVHVKKAFINGTHAIRKRGPVIHRAPVANNAGWFETMLEFVMNGGQNNDEEEKENDDDLEMITRGLRLTGI